MRIGIVNDLLLARETLRRAVVSTAEHQVAWLVGDGAEAVAAARRDPVDLILMDLIMPVMDGVQATRRIMADAPCPILVVTATVSGNVCKVYEAMGFGALDAVDTMNRVCRTTTCGSSSVRRSPSSLPSPKILL